MRLFLQTDLFDMVILQFKNQQMKNKRKMTARYTRRSLLSPESKKFAMHKNELCSTPPPDEETIRRLNSLVKQYPFCILHRYREHSLR